MDEYKDENGKVDVAAALGILFNEKKFNEHPTDRHEPYSENYPFAENMMFLLFTGVTYGEMDDFITNKEKGAEKQ